MTPNALRELIDRYRAVEPPNTPVPEHGRDHAYTPARGLRGGVFDDALRWALRAGDEVVDTLSDLAEAETYNGEPGPVSFVDFWCQDESWRGGTTNELRRIETAYCYFVVGELYSGTKQKTLPARPPAQTDGVELLHIEIGHGPWRDSAEDKNSEALRAAVGRLGLQEESLTCYFRTHDFDACLFVCTDDRGTTWPYDPFIVPIEVGTSSASTRCTICGSTVAWPAGHTTADSSRSTSVVATDVQESAEPRKAARRRRTLGYASVGTLGT